jgi:hypothetical protein
MAQHHDECDGRGIEALLVTEIAETSDHQEPSQDRARVVGVTRSPDHESIVEREPALTSGHRPPPS